VYGTCSTFGHGRRASDQSVCRVRRLLPVTNTAARQSTDDADAQSAIEYEIYVNGVLSPLAVGAGIDNDLVYGTASGQNTFTVKAADRAGNTSEASNAVTC
jgi:hypothetical protein